MPNIVFRFPGGRYHATPWGNHVNEGLVEWPPSPWRIIRALIATGFTKLGWMEVPDAARQLVEALSTTLPEFRLPAAVASHTRHWVPTDSKKPEDRTKIFDAFAHVGRGGEIGVEWTATLTPQALELLGQLVPRLSYLGRAESVVEARLVEDHELPAGDVASTVHRPGADPITLLAPVSQTEYARWLAESVGDIPAAKKSKKSPASPYPSDALAALMVDTEFLQHHGWTQPPGSRRVTYYRAPLATTAVRLTRSVAAPIEADTALLVLASDTQKREVLPLLARTMPQMELLHQALVSKVGDANCPELSGRENDGTPLRGHRHAVLLPLNLEREGFLDHVLVHAPMGFGANAQAALRAIRQTYTKGGRSPLYVTLAGLGRLRDFSRLAGREIPELASSKIWISRTPFILPRHLKAKKHTLEDQVQAELSARGLPRATRIECFTRDALVAAGFHRFVRARRDPTKAAPTSQFHGLRLELEAPVSGPLSLGYGSHFGLGVFAASV